MKNKIKELRTASHLSQEQLAEKSHVSVRTIQRLEAGEDASIATMNLVAGGLGVEVGDLFPNSNSLEENDKVQSADEQVNLQLQKRQEEFWAFNRIYKVVYTTIMLLWAIYFSWIENDTYMTVMGVLWIGAWSLMKPIRSWIIINVLDKKLDAKYPLTASRPDKNK